MSCTCQEQGNWATFFKADTLLFWKYEDCTDSCWTDSCRLESVKGMSNDGYMFKEGVISELCARNLVSLFTRRAVSDNWAFYVLVGKLLSAGIQAWILGKRNTLVLKWKRVFDNITTHFILVRGLGERQRNLTCLAIAVVIFICD